MLVLHSVSVFVFVVGKGVKTQASQVAVEEWARTAAFTRPSSPLLRLRAASATEELDPKEVQVVKVKSKNLVIFVTYLNGSRLDRRSLTRPCAKEYVGTPARHFVSANVTGSQSRLILMPAKQVPVAYNSSNINSSIPCSIPNSEPVLRWVDRD